VNDRGGRKPAAPNPGSRRPTSSSNAVLRLAAALLLVARGLVPDPASAVELMAKRRPRIHPTRSDWDFMERAAARLV